MWITAAMNLLKSPSTWIVIAFVAVIGFYEYRTYSLKNDILDVQETYNELHEDYIEVKDERNSLKVKLKNALEVSQNNIDQCILYKDSISDTIKIYDKQIIDKNNQIHRLKITINKLRNLPKPDLKNQIKVKDCTIYQGEIDETNNLRNIGK